MSIKITNTLTGKKEEFKPLRAKKVGMYVCGPTVYDTPHIGHARSAYIFDVIRRYLAYRKFKVTFVRNVTDVDDKIINKAREEYREQSTENRNLKELAKEISKKYLKEYHDAMDALGLLRPDKEPKATEYIKKMQAYIKRLLKNGAAYEAGGDVYFDIKKASGYGKLSNRSIDDMEAGARVAPGENKKDPLDFALWKKAKEGEPSWKSPWGEGRPGWHIECSVMSSDILGKEFDIHGGGRDLIFPHHENEIAQSEGAGCKFAHYWIHNGLLTISAQKMAKSLGNFITIDAFLGRYDADVLKMFFLQAHYSQPVDFTWEKMDEIAKARDRFMILFEKIGEGNCHSRESGNPEMAMSGFPIKSFGNDKLSEFKQKFTEAMDDDFNTPVALSVLFDMVNFANKLEDGAEAASVCAAIRELAGVFGLEFKKTKELDEDSAKEIEGLIAKRNDARKNKDFKTADEIRKQLSDKGIVLEDTKEATTWRRKASS